MSVALYQGNTTSALELVPYASATSVNVTLWVAGMLWIAIQYNNYVQYSRVCGNQSVVRMLTCFCVGFLLPGMAFEASCVFVVLVYLLGRPGDADYFPGCLGLFSYMGLLFVSAKTTDEAWRQNIDEFIQPFTLVCMFMCAYRAFCVVFQLNKCCDCCKCQQD